MSLKPSNAGVYQIGALNVDTLWVKGLPFQQYITQLQVGDQFEQQEIDEIRQIILYLNTSGLTTEWVVGNNNINAELKTALTALETKLAQIDTTALTQSSVLTNANRNSELLTLLTAIQTKLANIDTTTLTQSSVLTDDNRNSVLKTRIDGNDGTLTTLNNKTRYITESVVGSNTADPKTANSLIVSANTVGIDKSDIRLVSGLSVIRMKGNKATEQDNNYEDNSIFISAPGQMITTYSHLNRMQAQNKIEIGDFGIQNSAAINIGGKGAQINIGAIDDPDVSPSANTVITIGKRTTLRNTQTYLQGNFYTTEARLEDLDVTDVLTWGTAASWLSGFVFSGVPYWLAWVALSGVPNYRYADVVKMANNYLLTGGLTKNHSIETSNDLSLKALTIINTDLVSLSTPFDGLLNRLVFQAFSVHGSHSIGTIWGKVNMYCGSGEIELRNDGSVFDWAFKNAGNANQLLIKNLDVELIQCNGSSNDGKLILGACNGNIDLITGSSGNRSAATKVMEIKSNKQVLIGNNSAMVDNTYKVLVDATSHTNGIKVAKGSDALLLNPTNVSSKSLTLQDTYTGTTTKTLYTNANSDLMWDGQPVAVGSIAASGGGLTYVIPVSFSTTTTHANLFTTSLTMFSSYISSPLKTITLSSYNVDTNYKLVSILGAIPKAANPIISGTYELNQFVEYSAGGNAPGFLYAKLYFTGLPLNNVLINKTYTSPQGSGETLNISTPQILVPVNDVSITISSVTFPSVYVGGTQYGITLLSLTLVDQGNNILYTFPTIQTLNQSTFNRVFTPASPVTITDTTNITSLRFSLTSQNSNSLLSQASAFNASNANYVLEGSSIRMLLYDGTTNPSTLTPNAIALYPLSIPLPTTPFVITDYQNPNITLEEWFIQTTGSTTNHSVSLRFNDGALSHVHTSIASISATPTLSSVMTEGNSVGSNPLNMNSQNINNVATITATTVNTTNITATTLNATNIPNWNVKEITAGSGGMVVTNNGLGTYTISNDAQQASGQYLSTDFDYPITTTSAVNQKANWYGRNWSRYPDFTNTYLARDIYMSANGKYTVIATNGINLTPSPIFYSNNYALFYQTSALTKLWRSITGTADGSTLWAIQSGTDENGLAYARELWRSLDFGATWSQQTSPPDFANAAPHRIRVSADGKYQLITDGRPTGLGKLYRSTNYGVTWTSQNLTATTAIVDTIAISANGAVQYVELSSTTGAGGIYRSVDYGVNFNRINTTDPLWNISCDATGRIVAATTNTGVLTSRDYGQTWKDIAIAGATAISVSGRGDIIWIGCRTRTATTELYFSDDYGQTFVVKNTEPFGSYQTTNYISIVTNSDGSIIVGGGSQNLNWHTEGPQDIKFLSAGPGLSLTTFGLGSYYLTATETAGDYRLFANGSVYVPYDGATSTFNIDWASAGKIDLVAYDIKYEIEIHWDANTSTTTSWPYAFIEMGLNRVTSIDGLNQGIIMQSATNWTNLINSGPYGANTEYNQSFAGRFYAGFSQTNNANGGGTPPWRYKTLLSGHLNYTYRTVSQSGITDLSPNGRLIQNHFTCDSFLQQTTASNTLGIWYDTAANEAHANRIHGSALWDTSFNGKFTENSGTNEAISQGVYRIALRFHEGANFLTLRPRGAQIVYRIYRVKK